MCVSCNVALPIAESPQAQQEKDLIRQLVAQGLTKHQILDRLVDVYGPNVLAEPRKDDGVGLAAYLVPVAAALLLLGVLAVLLPRWRRRTPSRGGDGASTPALSADDAARLDEDLARYDP
jgi:cytochrome c-type biogenesis protein CcmH/NrfF